MHTCSYWRPRSLIRKKPTYATISKGLWGSVSDFQSHDQRWVWRCQIARVSGGRVQLSAWLVTGSVSKSVYLRACFGAEFSRRTGWLSMIISNQSVYCCHLIGRPAHVQLLIGWTLLLLTGEKRLSFIIKWKFRCEALSSLSRSMPLLHVFTYLCNLPLNASTKLYFRVILGLNIYYMGNRPTTMRYITKFGEVPHQNGLRISFIP